MALEMRISCEKCGTALAADGAAFICSYECTFCEKCATAMQHVCPNCKRRTGAAAAPLAKGLCLPLCEFFTDPALF